MESNARIEKDSMGEILVPSWAYWGAQTERSRQNFPIGSRRPGGERMPSDVIHALGLQKKIAALTNASLGILPQDKAAAIAQAAQEVWDGQWDDHFPLVIWQTGSGTQTHMNANEVIAHRANELLGVPLNSSSHIPRPIHPNDHVNRSQSSNDTFPTVMHMASVFALHDRLLPSLQTLWEILEKKRIAFQGIIKVGRTHLQDATPLTFGQEFSGYAQQILLCQQRIEHSLPGLYALAQGGTAVGTGVNCPEGFAERFAQFLAEETHFPFVSNPNKFEALSSHDALLGLSGALNALAAALMKIANDLRWLGSGPRCGLGELWLPENEPGSSIMPGKVNPTQIEALTMLICRVMGDHVAITFAASQGHFELNVFKPLIIDSILSSIDLLSDGINSFITRCLEGIEVNQEQCSANLANSLMLITKLTPLIGYDKSATIAKKALEENMTLFEAAQAVGGINRETFDFYVNPQNMLVPEVLDLSIFKN